jgi:hypothetical protein
VSSPHLHLRTGIDEVSETSCFYSLEYRTMEKVQKPSNSMANMEFNCVLQAHDISSVLYAKDKSGRKSCVALCRAASK